MAVHPPQEIARFLDSEPRLVYGRHRNDATKTFFLEDGRGGDEGLRAWVAENLECPMPACEDRRLSLVHRSGSARPRRDGFKHYAGAGGHAPESIWHSNAKEVVRRWAESRVADWATVDVEVPLHGGERTPDVLVSWPVQRVAFEIQYSTLSVSQWQERHDWYAAHGIKDVWLWGHAGHHMTPVNDTTSGERPQFKLNEVQRAVLASGERCLYWINPLTEQIASGYVPRGHEDHLDAVWKTFATVDDDVVELALDPMTTITDQHARGENALSGKGLFTSAWQRIRLESQLHEFGYDPANLAAPSSSERHLDAQQVS